MCRILIVDDDADVRDVLRTYLDGSGVQVIEASRGKEAVQIVARDPHVSLVLLDINMPVMGGAATAKAIHKLRHDLPICVVSSSADREAVCREIGAIACLPKPLRRTMLLKGIVKHTCEDHRDYFSQAAAAPDPLDP